MSTAVNKYCKLVGKKLCCLPQTKKTLLLGIRKDLAEYPNEILMDFHSIEESYGKADATAEMLMETVSDEEKAKAYKRNRINKWVHIGIGVFLLALALFIYLYVWDQVPIYFNFNIAEG